MLNGVLDGKLATLAAARVVDVGSSGSQLSYRSIGVRIIDCTEMRQMQRRAAVLAVWLVW